MIDSMVSVDLREDSLIVYWYVQPADGPWTMPGGFVVLAASSAESEIGAAVLDALDCSRRGVVPVSLEQGEGFRAMLRALKVSSVKKYSAGVLSVLIEREGCVVRLIPTENRGPSGGFVEIGELQVSLESPGVVELGRAVRAALDAR